MKNRFTQQQIPDNDQDKFELACELMIQKMQAETDVPKEVAVVASFALVSDCMQATKRLRKKIKRRWEQLSAQCVN